MAMCEEKLRRAPEPCPATTLTLQTMSGCLLVVGVGNRCSTEVVLVAWPPLPLGIEIGPRHCTIASKSCTAAFAMASASYCVNQFRGIGLQGVESWIPTMVPPWVAPCASASAGGWRIHVCCRIGEDGRDFAWIPPSRLVRVTGTLSSDSGAHDRATAPW
jgi:hypothetical protein